MFRALICFFSPVVRNVVQDVSKTSSDDIRIILPEFEVVAIEHLLNILNSGVACFAVLKDVVNVAKALGISLENIEHTDKRHKEKIIVTEKINCNIEINIKEEVSELSPAEENVVHQSTTDIPDDKRLDKLGLSCAKLRANLA